MPHNWASAEFIRLTVHLLALDRGDELHLLEGMPAKWLGPGMVTRLNGIATPFGPLYLTVQVQKDGKTATAGSQTAGRELQGNHCPSARREHFPNCAAGGWKAELCGAGGRLKNYYNTARSPIASFEVDLAWRKRIAGQGQFHGDILRR